MGRILAIDYGQKRIGLAVTDELNIAAHGLDTILVKDIHDYVKKYVSENDVDTFVVGLPVTLNNTPSESTPFVENFVSWLKNTFPNKRIERIDERFTSQMAFQTMIESGIGKKARRNKELIDKISATIILQSYLSTL
ncbi:MAG: Holliday junction resolvase RuvX [Bacteroidales bacterium]|nr:Holliday junction resolvase RuvX [Bacteroidales bacterium]